MKKRTTVGMDLGDKSHEVCVVGRRGEVVCREQVMNTKESVLKFFKRYKRARVAMETGTHSPWISRELKALGCDVLVADARKLEAISGSVRKSDVRDAEMLARLAQSDQVLLCPIEHRGREAQEALAIIKARDLLVGCRTKLINHVRCTVKSMGERLPSWGGDTFGTKAKEALPKGLSPALMPMVEEIEALTCRIKAYDRQIAKVAEKQYPEANRLSQVPGVGPITSLAFVLLLEDASRFKKSRTVGAYVGLTPRRDQSGQMDKQLRITKCGDVLMRRLLVGCAQYILGQHGAECDLSRFGHKLAERGGKNAKRRAVVAVARKLAVLLHHLWIKSDTYDPDYLKNQQKKAA